MKFISNTEVKQILLNLQNGEFNKLDSTKPDGDKPKYDFILNYITELDADARDSININGRKYLSDDEESINDNISQIINYSLLEIPRANEFDKFKDQAQSSQSQLRSLRSQIIEERNKIKQYEERVEKIQSEFISILSIFAAIFIAFFGGVQMLGSIMTAIKNSNFYVLSMATIIVGLILFNIIYMLLYTVGKIINRNIGIKISVSRCPECEKNNLLNCLISKYPLPFFYNIFSIFGFIFIFILFILDANDIFKYLFTSFIWLVNHKKWLNLFIVSVLSITFICIAIYLCIYLAKKINKLHKNKSCTNTNCNNTNLNQNSKNTNTNLNLA
ncbi:hypothetical protein [Paraclostridium sordellii]|uniref:hypothetical protein n=1 Tax=Paraclostridium sordellii TaxID=1505 RepID=UPI0030CEE37E